MKNLLITTNKILVLVLFLFLASCSKDETTYVREYIVKFDTDRGNDIPILKVKENSKITEPTKPIKHGFIFSGWYLNGALYDFTKNISEKDTKLGVFLKIIIISQVGV